MNTSLLIVGSACAALFIIEILRVPQYLKAYLAARWGRAKHRRLKPLDCETCLSFWISLIAGIFLGKNPAELLFISVTAPILAVLIQKLMYK